MQWLKHPPPPPKKKKKPCMKLKYPTPLHHFSSCLSLASREFSATQLSKLLFLQWLQILFTFCEAIANAYGVNENIFSSWRNSRRKSFPRGKLTLKFITGVTPRTRSSNNFAWGTFLTRSLDPCQKLEFGSRWIFSASPEVTCWYACRDLGLLAAVHGSV